MAERWKQGVPQDRRPDGSLRHSQVVSTFGPGALIDLVDEAAIVAGLSWWAKGPRIVEDRLLAMLKMQEGFENVELYGPPVGSRDLEDRDRRWIKAFRFPEWFVCQNERCWAEAGGTYRTDGAKPRRLLYVAELDGGGHKCSGKGRAHKVQPTRFTRACPMGHIADLNWFDLVHRKNTTCTAQRLWMDEAGSSGDLSDVRISCSGCKESLRMTLVAQRFDGDGVPILGYCEGKRPWLGPGRNEECSAPMRLRLLLRSASHAYFPVAASVIHIPDLDAQLREQVDLVLDLIRTADDVDELKFFVKKQEPIRRALEGLSLEAVFAEVVRRRENKPVVRRKVKEAEIDALQRTPPELTKEDPEKQRRFLSRELTLPKDRSGVLASIDKVVLLPRLTEVRALAGFTRFDSRSTDIDGELDIGAEVARLDDPLSWLPAVENSGEGFFFSLREDALKSWEKEVSARNDLFREGFKCWQQGRPDRKDAKADFANARFVMLHSLSHLLITAVSLECGYSASSIRERLYTGAGGNGILLYTASPGAEGSLGGLVDVGRNLERYLKHALDLGKLCSNDPVCAAHVPDTDGTSDRHLEGASCHGCLLISEPSCERLNVYLDRSLVVPTVETDALAFFKGW